MVKFETQKLHKTVNLYGRCFRYVDDSFSTTDKRRDLENITDEFNVAHLATQFTLGTEEINPLQLVDDVHLIGLPDG